MFCFIQKPAICGTGMCGHNAHCDSETCVCNQGYFGDFPATWGCDGKPSFSTIISSSSSNLHLNLNTEDKNK